MPNEVLEAAPSSNIVINVTGDVNVNLTPRQEFIEDTSEDLCSAVAGFSCDLQDVLTIEEEAVGIGWTEANPFFVLEELTEKLALLELQLDSDDNREDVGLTCADIGLAAMKISYLRGDLRQWV